MNSTATGLFVSPNGEAYIAAVTNSPNMPLSANAGEKTIQSLSSGYLAKISGDGSRLLYGSYFNEGQLQAVAADSQGGVYLTGIASKSFLPTAGAAETVPPSACPRTNSLFTDFRLDNKVFVEKWKPDFSALAYATYLGGSCGEGAFSLAVDGAGSVWIAGTTYSPDFPTTASALQKTFQATDNLGYFGNVTSGFVAALSPAGDRIVYATFLGQTSFNQAKSVAVDGSGNVFVTGSTFGLPLPASPGAFQTQVAKAACPTSIPIIGPATPVGSDAFVLRLNPSNASDYNFTYLGGNCDDSGNSLALDPAGSIWVAGSTNSSNFPTLVPFGGMGSYGGFVSEFSSDMTRLLYSSYAPSGTVALDSQANAELAGSSVGLPKTAGNGMVTISRIGAQTNPPIEIDSVLRYSTPVSSPYYQGAGIAPGEVVRIHGQNLGPQTAIPGAMTDATTIATQADGIRVLFDVVPAPLLQLQAQEILCVVPFLATKSTAQIVVVSGVQSSNGVLVATGSPLTDPMLVLNQNFSLNSVSNPANSGSIITIYDAGPIRPSLGPRLGIEHPAEHHLPGSGVWVGSRDYADQRPIAAGVYRSESSGAGH